MDSKAPLSWMDICVNLVYPWGFANFLTLFLAGGGSLSGLSIIDKKQQLILCTMSSNLSKIERQFFKFKFIRTENIYNF